MEKVGEGRKGDSEMVLPLRPEVVGVGEGARELWRETTPRLRLRVGTGARYSERLAREADLREAASRTCLDCPLSGRESAFERTRAGGRERERDGQ